MLRAILGRIRNGQKGFTLIELLAVMGIVAVLASIVATSVAGTGDKSRDATAKQDGGTTNTSAGAYFGDQGAPVLTTVVTTLTVDLATDPPSAKSVVTSTTWPEARIATDATGAANDGNYSDVFPISGDTNDTLIKSVTMTTSASPSTNLDQDALLTDYTAVNFSTMITGGYTDKIPASDSLTKTVSLTDGGSVTIHEYLWLFIKSTSSFAVEEGNTDDSRTVTVWTLTTITEDVSTSPDSLDLIYEQIF